VAALRCLCVVRLHMEIMHSCTVLLLTPRHPWLHNVLTH